MKLLILLTVFCCLSMMDFGQSPAESQHRTGAKGSSEVRRYSVEGTLTGFAGRVAVFLSDDETGISLDSGFLEKGRFHMQGTDPNAPRYVSVVLHEGGQEYSYTVFIGQGKVTLSGDKKDFPYHIRVSGPPEQAQYNDFIRSSRDLYAEADARMQDYRKSQGDSVASRNAAIAYNAVGNRLRARHKAWLFSHPNTYYSAKGMYDYTGEFSADSVRRFYASLSPAIRRSLYGQRLHTYLTLGGALRVNDPFFDFEAFEPSGKKWRLSDSKGKYILLDFSTIHCGPCEQSVEEIRRLSDQYKDRLAIVTFSIDGRGDWLSGIRDHTVSWTTVSDGKGWYSKVLLKYGVQVYPSFCLISPEGRIVDKWIGYEKVSEGLGDIEKHIPAGVRN